MFFSLLHSINGLSLAAICIIAAAKELPNPPPQKVVEAAAKVSTGNSAKCNISSSLFFPAKVDHATFNGDWNDTIQTFLQQYLVIDKFYKPGSPIFLIPDGENPVVCLDDYWYTDLAEEFGALVVRPEHRYFGLSTPHGLNYSESPTWDPALLKEMTLDNIELDIMTLLSWLKNDSGYEGCGDSKVAIMGGMKQLHLRWMNCVDWRFRFLHWHYCDNTTHSLPQCLLCDVVWWHANQFRDESRRRACRLACSLGTSPLQR